MRWIAQSLNELSTDALTVQIGSADSMYSQNSSSSLDHLDHGWFIVRFNSFE